MGTFGKAFWLLVGLLLLEFAYYLFGIGYFTERRLEHGLEGARRETLTQDLYDDLNYLTQILADYESHVAAAEVILPDPDKSGIDSVREQLAYCRQVVGTPTDSMQRADQRAIAFFENYEPPPIGVLRAGSVRRVLALLWVTAGVAGVALLCMFYRPEF